MLSPFRILQKKRYNTFDSKLIRIKTHLSNTEYTVSSNKNKNKIIGHLHHAVISLLPESISFFLSYLNLVIPARFKTTKALVAKESKTLKHSGICSKMTPSCKWPFEEQPFPSLSAVCHHVICYSQNTAKHCHKEPLYPTQVPDMIYSKALCSTRHYSSNKRGQ